MYHDEHIPERAGIIVVKRKENNHLRCIQTRKPKESKGYKLTDKERSKMAHLGAMRIWGLKKKLTKSL